MMELYSDLTVSRESRTAEPRSFARRPGAAASQLAPGQLYASLVDVFP